MMMKFYKIMKANLSLVTVEPVMFLYMMIIFMETSGLQGLIFTKVCLHTNHPNDTNDCNKNETAHLTNVVHDSSVWLKYFNTTLFCCTLIVSLYIGSWSDYFGRKIPMMIPAAGSFVAAGINATLSVFLHSHVEYFFISAAVSGFTFGIVGIISSTFGYISDITTEDSRTKRIVILEAMIFIGGTVGMYIAGAILKQRNLHTLLNKYFQVFLLEMSIALFIVLYIIFRIEKTGSSDSVERNHTSKTQLFNLNHVRNALQTVFKQRENKKRTKIFLLMIAITMLYFGSAVQFTLSFLFLKNKPLNWDVTDYSYYNGLQFALEGAALLFGLPVALHILHVSDSVVAIAGTISRTAGLILFGLSTDDFMVYLCALIFMLSEFPVAAVRSMLSKLVDKDEKGKIFALTTIIQNLCYLTGSLILNTIFASSLKFFPGLSFELVACLQAIALAIFCYIYCIERRNTMIYEELQ